MKTFDQLIFFKHIGSGALWINYHCQRSFGPVYMHGSKKFYQRGPTLPTFFFLCLFCREERRSKYHNMRANIGPPAKRHLNGVSLTCRWLPNIERWLGSLVLFQGIRTSIAMKPHIFLIFQRGPDPLFPPSGSAHEYS